MTGMPHDFGSSGSQGRHPRAPSIGGVSGGGPGSVPGIGFHELRQALEISTLREDVERLTQGLESLRTHVEDAVEQVRDRFALLSADEMADAAAMAPLLEFAVATLLETRERVRRLDSRTGPASDDDRPGWSVAADRAPRRTPLSPSADGHQQPDPAAAFTAPVPVPPMVEADPDASVAVQSPRRAKVTPSTSAGSGLAASVSNMPPSSAPPANAPLPRGRDAAVTESPARDNHPAFSPLSPPPVPASWLTSESPPSPRSAVARGPASSSPGGIDWLGPAGR